MNFFSRLRLKNHLLAGLRFAGKLRKKGLEDALLEQNLLALSKALSTRQDDEAIHFAAQVEDRIKASKKRGILFAIGELVLTLIIAISAAALIRQTCFELYEIPTGSMRPTFKEQDRVYVSKSTYGINIPFTPGHLFFSPQRVARGDTVVMTAENLDCPDVDTVYFGIFPGKKRYTKRLVALPDDTVYFYGGDLYCLEKDGKTIVQLQSNPSIPPREYIPFICRFEGRVESQPKSSFTKNRSYLLKHFNMPVGRIDMEATGATKSEIMHQGSWIPEFSPTNTTGPKCYGEFYGINNYALCRAILPLQIPTKAKNSIVPDDKAAMWLEVHHSPTLPISKYAKETSSPLLNYCVTYIPLHEEHLENITKHLYTARFVVENNAARRYHFEGNTSPAIPLPSPVPNGCYEFYNGKAYSVGFGGMTSELSQSHPLYPKSVRELCFWINFGIDFMPECAIVQSPHMPTRFAYFKNSDLFFMGGLAIPKEDPILKDLAMREMAHQAKDLTYFAFQDAHGTNGLPITPQYIQTYGFHIPEKHYLLLGDNPAMSLDSRFFGPIPEDNLQGSPILLFWPFGERFGWPLEPSKLPSIYTIGLLALFILGIYCYKRTRTKKALRFLKELQDEHPV